MMDFHDRDEAAEAGVWTTKDGREIPVAEMATSHLENTLTMLKRRSRAEYRSALHCLIYANPSGDGACDAVDRELGFMTDEMDPDDYWRGNPIVWWIEGELEFRTPAGAKYSRWPEIADLRRYGCYGWDGWDEDPGW